MSKKNFQKIKLLKLWEMLTKESHSERPLDTVEIIERLAKQGIACDRKTLYSDIKELNAYGYKVYQKRSRRNQYYADCAKFSVPEVRILIDAVQSAKFISEQKTEELVDKLANLAGNYKADMLKNGVYFDTQKYNNKAVFHNIQKIEEAIYNDKKISFRYFDYDENVQVVYRKKGDRYLINPLALVLNDDCYYLVCYSDKYQNLANYRVDRIDDITITDQRIEIAECALDFDIAEYRRKTFMMYTGKAERVEIVFDKSLIDVMLDKFGVGIKIESAADDKYKLTAEVQVSPVFFGWCTNFGTKLTITKPKPVRNKYVRFVQDIVDTYGQ